VDENHIGILYLALCFFGTRAALHAHGESSSFEQKRRVALSGESDGRVMKPSRVLHDFQQRPEGPTGPHAIDQMEKLHSPMLPALRNA
jgi:hypothetical protein